MDYSEHVEKLLAHAGAKVGDKVLIEKDVQTFEGTIMPNTGDPSILIIKLKSGYNVGIHIEGAKIKKIEHEQKEKHAKHHYEHEPGKKTILILHTGGTIASKVDYETGAVKPAIAPEDIILSIPELSKIANIRTEIVFQMFSEDMNPDHWLILAKKVAEEYERYDGVIVTHGTDTMHYTAAALSFMLRGIQKPVILVGSQRSSDRGSSDATMNIICAAQFIVKSDFNGVAICMHGTMNDDFCYIHSGLHARKMHTSRRDAFKSIDVQPIAKVTRSGNFEYIEYKSTNPQFHPVFAFEKKVALVKLYPGFRAEQLNHFKDYKGIVLEGTGLGHAAVNETDAHTKDNPALLETIRNLSEDIVIVMTSQCIFGKVNLNVYSTGRKLTDAGIIPAQMTPETAYVKLGWVLGQKQGEEAKELFKQNLVGEIVERIDPTAFIE